METVGNWATIGKPETGLTDLLSEQVAGIERQEPGIVPELRRGGKLYVGSDYGGRDGHAKYETYSFVITDESATPEWNRLREKWRQRHWPGPETGRSPEMSYKDLHKDEAMAASLGGFLRAANRLRGLVLTVAVEQSVEFMSADRQPEDNVLWKPRVYDRVIRYCNFVGLLVSGLSREGQEVGWCTDRDEIAATQPQQDRLAQVAKDVMFPYLAHGMGKLVVKDNSNEPDMRWSDFLSVADLSASAFSHILDRHQETLRDAGAEVVERFSMDGFKSKTKEILDWYAQTGHPLRRLFLMIDPNPDIEQDGQPFAIGWPRFVTPSRSMWAGRECVRKRRMAVPGSDRKAPTPS